VRPRLLLGCLLFIFIALLAAASVGAAAKPQGRYAQSDGTLSLKGGRGSFALLAMTGSVLGRIDKGTLTLTDPDPMSGGAPIVRGYQWIKSRSANTIQYGGKKPIRFRILGGRFDLRIDGATGAELSVVGQGRAMLDGAGFDELGLSDGQYSLNDSPYVEVPGVRTWLTVKAPRKGPPPPPPPHGKSQP
jgi:hypothetical protein